MDQAGVVVDVGQDRGMRRAKVCPRLAGDGVSSGPLGSASGADRLHWRIADLLTHGWDLTQATGEPIELPDDLVEEALIFVRDQLPNQPRAGRFADPQPITDTAPAIEQLAAFTGRPVPQRRLCDADG
jgi:uncharacterized protein (TIGR03086 family)